MWRESDTVVSINSRRNSDLIREVLNENIPEIRRLALELGSIDGGRWLNDYSECGETVAHIAIYKAHRKMLRIFLDAGVDPNCRNKSTETLIHVAAKLGQFQLLLELYKCGRCDLNLLTCNGQTALDLCSGELNVDEDILVMRNFKNWTRGTPDDIPDIILGRKKCAVFLRESMPVDDQAKLDRLTGVTSKWMLEQAAFSRHFAEADHTYRYHSPLSQGIDYPSDSHTAVDPEDQKLFNRFVPPSIVHENLSFIITHYRQLLKVPDWCPSRCRGCFRQRLSPRGHSDGFCKSCRY